MLKLILACSQRDYINPSSTTSQFSDLGKIILNDSESQLPYL